MLTSRWAVAFGVAVACMVIHVSAALASATPYHDAVLADNPGAWWRFDDPAGSTTAADSSGRGPALHLSGSGVALGADTALMGESGGAISMTGGEADTWGAAEALPVFQTIELWVEVTQPVPAGGETIISVDSGARGVDPAVRIAGDGHVVGTVQENFGGTLRTVSGPDADTVNDGEFHYVVFVINGTSSQVFVDGDGGVVGGTTGPAPCATAWCPYSMYPPTVWITYGTGAAGSGPWVNLDEVALYGTALTPEQVAGHFEAASGGTRLVPLLGAGQVNFGGRLVWSSCCTLSGVRSSIETPGADFVLRINVAGAMRVTAEAYDKTTNAAGLAQAGVVKTQDVQLAPSCSYIDHLQQYVEFKIFNSASDFTCTKFDVVADTVDNSRYAVIHEPTSLNGPGYWAAYIDGGFVAQQQVGFDDASVVGATGEFSTGLVDPPPYGYAYGCFGCDGGTPWQRTADSYQPGSDPSGLDWHTVRSSRLVKDDDLWTVGNPLYGGFVIQHPYEAP